MKSHRNDKLKILEKPPSSSCCAGPGSSASGVKQIDVGGMKIGIRGLDEILEKQFDAGVKPEDVNADQLVNELGDLNYIAEGSREVYKEALVREYRRYFEGKK